VWWIVAPTFSDDGWVWAEHRVFADVGANNVYLDLWGINSPTGFWFEWLRHWADGSTSELVFARVPSLFCLVVTWFLCRHGLRRSVGEKASAFVQWNLAAAFLVGAMAWGMTLRPEPFMSLFVLVSLIGMLAFEKTPHPRMLGVAVAMTVLAATAHPVGLLAAAPLIAGLPQVARWVLASWRRVFDCLVVVVAAVALGLVVFALNSDLSARLADFQIAQNGNFHSVPWWREYLRYTQFDSNGGETPLRHLSLALLIFPLLAYVARGRKRRVGISSLPARTLAVGLLLLALVSSKWPWHFGALWAAGAIAAAVEVERLIREREGVKGRIHQKWMLLAFGGAAVWAWGATGKWTAWLDLQRLTWADAFGARGYGLVVIPLLLSGALVLRSFWKRRGKGLNVLSSGVAWMVPVVSAALISVTVVTLAVDAAISQWSPTRQNLGALVGRAGCGLGDQLQGPTNAVRTLSAHNVHTLLAPAVGMYFPCANIPGIRHGLVEAPAFVASEPQLGPWPFFNPIGPFGAFSDLYRLRLVARTAGGADLFSVDQRVSGFARLTAVRVDGTPTDRSRS
jgi:hypothetical protein